MNVVSLNLTIHQRSEMLGRTVLRMQVPVFVVLLIITGATATSDISSEDYATDLIVGGQVVKKNTDWPWVVGFFNTKEGNTKFLCGATLVSRHVVVTAAHCLWPTPTFLEAKDIFLVMGTTKVLNWTEESNVQIRKVQAVIFHPLSHQSRDRPDLAFLQLEFPVTITATVKPVELWDEASDHQRTGNNGTVVGWGMDENGSIVTEILKETTIPIVTNEMCQESNPTFRTLAQRNFTYCAGNRDETGPCNGDSGSGMYVPRYSPDNKRSWVLRGMVSRTLFRSDQPGICDLNNYIIFTDMAKLTSWLTDTSCSFKHPQTFGALNMTRLGDKYYYIEYNWSKRLNWTSAQQFCQSHGLQLVSIETEEENNLIWKHIYGKIPENLAVWRYFWLGGSYSQQDRTWRWTNGQKLNFTDLVPGKSDSYYYGYCLLMLVWRDGSHWWWGYPCSRSYSFVCELEDVCS